VGEKPVSGNRNVNSTHIKVPIRAKTEDPAGGNGNGRDTPGRDGGPKGGGGVGNAGPQVDKFATVELILIRVSFRI
jgi:hypothetical protein